MPLFFIIAIAAGVLTTGAVVTDAKRYTGTRTAEATFDVSAHQSVADCLTAASNSGVSLDACEAKE